MPSSRPTSEVLESVRRLEARWQATVECAPDAIVVVNGEGLIELVNQQAERMFGYGREELLVRSVEVLLPARLRTQHFRHRTRFLQAPAARPMGANSDLYGMRKDGSEFPVDVSLSPLEPEDSQSVAAAIRDITARAPDEWPLNADPPAVSSYGLRKHP